MRTSPLYNPLLIDNTAACGSFGMMIKSREFVGFDQYRMGFNGQEKDDEISGEGNSINFAYRVYDSRLARFLSIDPLGKKYPWYTPYQFAGNTPIEAKELEGLEPNHTAQKSGCEDCKEATLNDGDYFSDVQAQKYTTTFSNIDQKSFESIKKQFSIDPGSVINNDRAKYRLVDRDGSYGVTVGDHFDIDISGSPDGYVVVKSVIAKQNSIQVQVQTLKGHPDAGSNTFTLSYDPKTQTVTWQTFNISRTNDNLSAGLGAGVASARKKQQQQWKDVAKKVFDKFSSAILKSATAVVKEFDYDDYKNKVGDEEKDESFTEDFSKEIQKQ